MNTVIKTFYVAGVSHRPAELIEPLGDNEKIRFVAEPDNKYDNNAIKIECLFEREPEGVTTDKYIPDSTWEHIGYVPKGDTWLYHLLRQLNVPIKLQMVVNQNAEPHRKLLVSVFVDTNPDAAFV